MLLYKAKYESTYWKSWKYLWKFVWQKISYRFNIAGCQQFLAEMQIVEYVGDGDSKCAKNEQR